MVRKIFARWTRFSSATALGIVFLETEKGLAKASRATKPLAKVLIVGPHRALQFPWVT